MKRLIIARHAQAIAVTEISDDFHRPLTDYGFSQARELAHILQEENLLPDIVITSPAVRAAQTTVAMIEEWDIPKNRVVEQDVIYHSSLDVLLHMVQMLENEFKAVMIVGHNPDLTTFTQYLCYDFRETLPTSSAVVLEFKEKEWHEVEKNKARLLAFKFPGIMKE